METFKEIQTEVMRIHNLFWESYARRDIDLRFSLCSDDITFIGSGLHERATNKEDYKRINIEGVKQFPGLFKIEFLWTNFDLINENVACVESEVIWSQPINNEMSKELYRNTTLLKYESNEWRVVHVHGSVPDYRLKDGDYMTNEKTLIRNKELERQVFERTRDLNKTLEELEQKNRELEIEAALEKVRASAMSMHKSEDLLNVSEILYMELRKLGFDEIRNAMINIHNDEKATLINYDFSDEIGSSTNHLTYDIHPVIEKQIRQIRSANDAFSETSFTGKDLEEWKKFRQRIGEKDDSRINNISALYYYFYSIGNGSVGISTFNPIDEEKLELLKRFRNVFSLSYQRYSDIALAETQAKEAKIEAALERVRAKAMAMHTSNDLSDTMGLIFTELPKLGINSLRCGVDLLSKTSRRGVFYAAATTSDSDSFTMIGAGDMAEHPVFMKQYEGWLNNENYFTSLSDEDLHSYYKAIFARLSIPYVPKEHELQTEHGYYFAFSEGMFYAWSEKPYAEDEINLLNRFKAIIDLTFRRYLDLQKAEAQAREAQIELALERVRARTMAMQKSEELKDVIRVVFEQFVHLKINVDHSGFVVDYTPKGDWHFWIADEQDIPSKITHPYFESVWANQFNEAKEKGAEFFVTNLNFEEKNKFYNELLSYVPGLSEASKDFYLNCPGLAATTVLFDNVSLYIENFSGTPYSDEENKILMRFGKVFQQTYTRFLDLQKSEAQAREAQIEAALERVRSKAMAMNSPEDLAITVDTFFSELNKLDIVPHRCGVGIVDPETRIADIRATAFTKENVSKKIVGKLKLAGHPVLDKIFENWEQRQEYHPVLKGNEISEYYKVMNSQVTFPDFADDEIQYGHYFHFKEGGVFAWTDKELKEEDLQIFRRYTSVLSLTYRRYAELKEAEAQAREAKIEASLERVRSKAMAMHSPNDLSETVNIFFKELKTLGITPIRCGVGQIDGVTRTTSLTTTTSSQQGESFHVIGKVKQTGHPVLDGIFEHWKLQKEYHPVLEGEDIKAYYDVMNPQIGYPEYPQGVAQYGNNFFFKEGFVFAWTENLLSEEELIIFRRFTSVLSLTYRRYLDLKEAEERNNIIQAENDRKTKELEEARQLQLSLLPRSLPQLSQFDIAVYMKTATEVGGDYYDFNVQPNGVLNIGIGDATGHGLQAGTMITLMKGFFTADVTKFNPQKFLEHCNGLIRNIKLGRILMSFSHLRFENSRFLVSSAGMPPVYYHHKKNNRTEEIIIQGLPLGALHSTSYKLVEKELNCGDTILLLTDGLPEQMNSHKVIFDYSRVLKYFDEIAENTPNEIINRLVQKADEWMAGQKQNDDITFVVIRVK